MCFLYFLPYIFLTMATKVKKYVPYKIPIFRCASTSSSSISIPTHIRSCDLKSQTDFDENFSGLGIHAESQVILSNFSDTMLLGSFRSCG